MEKILWKDQYSVGIEQFDRQHRHLFEIISKLVANSDASPDLGLVTQTLKEVYGYAKEHFTDEEKLMQQYAYPEIESQKKQHAYFLKTTSELSASHVNKRGAGIGEIAEFLNIWWTIHILKWDMKYKEFFKAKLPVAVG